MPNPNPISISIALGLFLQSDLQLEGLVGGVNSLDSVPTVEGFKWLAAVNYVSQMYFYRLRVGNDAESLPSIVRPKDYNPVSNEQVWERVPTPSGGGGGQGEVYSGNGPPEGVQACISGDCIYVQRDSAPPGSMWSFTGTPGTNIGWA